MLFGVASVFWFVALDVSADIKPANILLKCVDGQSDADGQMDMIQASSRKSARDQNLLSFLDETDMAELLSALLTCSLSLCVSRASFFVRCGRCAQAIKLADFGTVRADVRGGTGAISGADSDTATDHASTKLVVGTQVCHSEGDNENRHMLYHYDDDCWCAYACGLCVVVCISCTCRLST